MPSPPLNATRIVSVVNHHHVQYVVIGAFAAITQLARIPATRDIDLTPEASCAILHRLSAALKELKARIRTDSAPGVFPFDHDGASLADALVWNLICSDREFDLSFQPAAFAGGYSALEPRAHRVSVDGVEYSWPTLPMSFVPRKPLVGRRTSVLPTLYRHLERLGKGSASTP